MPRGSKPGERRGGRVKGVPNKATAEIKSLAQQWGPQAIATLAEIMTTADQPAPARVAAAKELIDRGYGKAVQAVEMSGPNGEPIKTEDATDYLTNLPKEKRAAIRAALEAAVK